MVTSGAFSLFFELDDWVSCKQLSSCYPGLVRQPTTLQSHIQIEFIAVHVCSKCTPYAELIARFNRVDKSGAMPSSIAAILALVTAALASVQAEKETISVKGAAHNLLCC